MLVNYIYLEEIILKKFCCLIIYKLIIMYGVCVRARARVCINNH